MKHEIIPYTAKYKSKLLHLIDALNNFEHQIEKTKLNSPEDAKIYFDKLTSHPSTKVYLLEINDKIAGFASTCIVKEDDTSSSINKYCLLQDFYIEEKYRHQGFGKLLLKEVEKYAKTNKTNHLLVYSLADNYNALVAYRKLGFRKYEVALTKEI